MCADSQLHQPPGGERDHLAQDIGVARLLNQALQAHLLIGHRCFLAQVGVRNPTHNRRIIDDRREATHSYSVNGKRAAVGFATALLHHPLGQDTSYPKAG
jgi:hypothetical protein